MKNPQNEKSTDVQICPHIIYEKSSMHYISETSKRHDAFADMK